jgi:TP901 family phage tail tape measure protein
MADAQISFGIDTRELFAGLQNVSTQTQQTISKLEQDAKRLGDALVNNMSKGAGGIANSKRELLSFVDENKKALAAMQLNGEAGTKAYKAIEDSVKKAQQEVAKIDDAAKKVDASLAGIGDGGNAATGKIGGMFSGLTDKIPGLSGGLGNLGGSFQSLAGGVTGLVPGLGSLTGVLAGGGITAGIAAVGAGVAYAIDKGKEFETQLASLSSITGVSGAGLQDLGNKAQTMATKFGTDASANIDAFKTILSKLGPDIAKSPEALNSMAESVNTLSKATGDTPGAATEALTGALLQFGVDLADPKNAADAMAVAMNTLAAGAKFGASEVPEVAAAINVAGVAASKSKVSFEETNSAIQILAAGGKVGAEAGTSLRNVLNKLGEGRFLPKDTAKELEKAGVDINKLGDTSITFSERLRELQKIQSDAALTTKLFGTDSAAASILIKGALNATGSGMDALTANVTGTQTATEQAKINMATFSETLARVKSNIDNFAIAFYQGLQQVFNIIGEAVGPSLQRLFDGFAGTWQRIWSVVGPILALIGGAIISSIVYAIDIIAETANIAYNVFISVFDGILNAVQPIIDAFKQVGAVIGDALGFGDKGGETLDFMAIFQSVLNGVGDAIRFVADLISGALSGAISFVLTPVRFLAEVIGSVITKVAEWIKQSGILETVIGAVTSAVDFFQGIIQSIEGAFNAVIAVVNDLIGFWNEMTSIVNLSGNVWQGFQSALNSVWEIIKNVANAIFDFGANIITTYLIEPVKAAIGWVTGIVSKIGEWVLSFGAVQGVITILRNAAAGVSSFFANIGSYIDVVKMAIGGIVSALNEVGNLVSEFFGAISRADFSGAYNVVANSINRISSAYKEGQETAGKYLQAQKDQEAQAAKMANALDKLAGSSTNAANKQKVLNDFIIQDTTEVKPPPGGDDDTEEKEKGKTEKTITEFQKRKNAYDQFAARLEVSRESEFAKFTDQQKRESSEYQKRLLNDSNKLNEFLNEQFQKSKTTEFLDLPVKIKPQGDTETDVNIQKFYVDTFLKNRDAVNKLADAQLKEQLKTEAEARKQAVADAEKQYKELSDIIAADIKQNTTAIATAIPNTGALTQAQYDEAKKNGDDYIETLRAKGRFINDQLVNAQIAGADKAAEALQKQLDANNGLLSSAEQRLAAYVDASDVTLQNSTLANVAAYAAQRALIGAFLNDKTQAEREQAEQARAARLAELNQEETDLETSLAKREVSFDEFQQKLGAIADARREQEGDAENNFNAVLANLKRSGEQALNEIAKQQSAPMIATAKEKQTKILAAENDLSQAQRALNRTLITDTEAYAKAQQDVAEKTKALADVDEQTYGFRTAVLEEFAGRAIEQFGALAATGTATLGDFGKAGLKIAADLLAQQIPIFVAQIFGTTVGQLGPFGVVVAGGLTATLWALYNEAVAGFKTGGYTGDAGTDEVTGVVHGQEYVLNAEATRANRDVLEWANKTNRPISEYYKFHTVETSTTAVTHDGQLINEVQKLREETRNLGVHIRRNTTVELTGQLVADGNSINAMIEYNKRKTIRRG